MSDENYTECKRNYKILFNYFINVLCNNPGTHDQHLITLFVQTSDTIYMYVVTISVCLTVPLTKSSLHGGNRGYNCEVITHRMLQNAHSTCRWYLMLEQKWCLDTARVNNESHIEYLYSMLTIFWTLFYILCSSSR